MAASSPSLCPWEGCSEEDWVPHLQETVGAAKAFSASGDRARLRPGLFGLWPRLQTAQTHGSFLLDLSSGIIDSGF